jgi:tetratricopeptide (TPR) repeat protein
MAGLFAPGRTGSRRAGGDSVEVGRGAAGRSGAVRAAAPLLACLVALAGAAGCAGKKPVVQPSAPRFADFVFPAVPAELRSAAAAVAAHGEAWAVLQAGDAAAAERRFDAVLKRTPGFYPSQAGAGYAALARKDLPRALDRFSRAVGAAPRYAPALAGRGETLLALGRRDEALASFEQAAAADPALTDVARRVEVLRFAGVQDAVQRAQDAARDGRWEDARQAYLRALTVSPGSAFLHRELAGVHRQLADDDAALAELRLAVAADGSDGAAVLMTGEIHEERAEWAAAAEAYRRARDLGAGDDLDERIARVEERAALAALPAEFRAIPAADRVTRGDVAALVGVRLPSLVAAGRRRPAVLVTDARGHWARAWILDVARAGLMEVYANHTFQPATTVRRQELAGTVSRILGAIGTRDPAQAARWRAARPRFSDMGPGHLSYGPAAVAVGAGILPVGDREAFQPSRVVTGAEAAEAVQRLEALLARTAGQGPR